MQRTSIIVVLLFLALTLPCSRSVADDFDSLMATVVHEVSGNRARDIAARIWQHDKWSTLPGWKRSSVEIRTIMLERGFDDARIFEKPADGRSLTASWTTPIGWDATSATLEVIEPANIPEEYRYLADYSSNPTSLGCWSAPTPPEGIEAELLVLDRSGEDDLKKQDVRGKILLVSSNSRGMKKYLAQYGAVGIVSDQIESHSQDSVTANNWLNGWTDIPGGWLMTDYDGKNDVRFSISQRKADYLRNLIRNGITVKVRAKVDSRYYTDDTLPYTVGYIRGSGAEGEDVLIGGHNHEWGATDNAAGCASAIEAAGVLNDLIGKGVLPRPKRGIRLWFGSEIHGSLAYAVDNLEHLRTKTVASLLCDDGGGDYDDVAFMPELVMNPNSCPTFADALLETVTRKYYEEYQPQRILMTSSYMMADNLFCDPMIGVPSNWIKMNNTNHYHHNSKDTIDKVDPRSLRDVSVISALFLYFAADAGFDDVMTLAGITSERGMRLVLEKYGELSSTVSSITDGVELGRLRKEGPDAVEYYAGLQKQALFSIERLVERDRRKDAHEILARYADKIDALGRTLAENLRDAVDEQAKAGSVKIVKYREPDGDWEREAATIKPVRNYIGVYSLQHIPVDEWAEVRSDPHWWGATTWGSCSLWWCDGKRDLNEIKRLCELEAGVPIRNFDLIKYFRFLEKYDMVEFK